MPRLLIDWGILGHWLEMGRALKGTGEEAHAFTSQFWHIFQAKKQIQLKHQKKRETERQKEKEKGDEREAQGRFSFKSWAWGKEEGGEKAEMPKWEVGKG